MVPAAGAAASVPPPRAAVGDAKAMIAVSPGCRGSETQKIVGSLAEARARLQTVRRSAIVVVPVTTGHKK